MREVKLYPWGLFLSAILLVCCVLMPAGSANADGDTVPQSSSEDVETIIVTARRRAENLQETPIAVTALTNATLENRGFTELSDIARATPSLTFNGSAPISGNPAAASVFIRGIGQIDFASNTDPGVGIYLDGVYIARSVGSVLELVDPDRVEVLRGPQGTLFGRNTIGGAINIVSRAPSSTFEGKVSLTTGSDNLLQTQSSVDIPISETLLTQFSIFAKYRDGYVGRPSGDDLGDDGKVAGRAAIEWLPMKDLTVTLSADRTRTREDGSGNVPIQINGVSFDGVGGGFKSLYNKVVIGGACTNPVTANASRSCYGAAWQTDDPYYTNSTYPSLADTDVWGTALTTDWQPGPIGIKSITAYRGVSSEFGRDADDTPFDLQFTYNTVKQQQFSEELQFSGIALKDQFKWLLGLYYFEEFAKDFSVLGGPVDGVTGFNHIHNSNYAVFGEATYDFTHWLHLTMGGRWTDETKRIAEDQVVIGGILLPVGEAIVVDPSEHSLTVTNFSPRITLAADVADDRGRRDRFVRCLEPLVFLYLPAAAALSVLCDRGRRDRPVGGPRREVLRRGNEPIGRLVGELGQRIRANASDRVGGADAVAAGDCHALVASGSSESGRTDRFMELAHWA